MVELRDYVEIILPGKFQAAMERVKAKPDPQVTLMNVIVVALMSILAPIIALLAVPAVAQLLDTGGAASKLLDAVIAIVLFYAGMYVLLFIARALGGEGRFEEQAHLFSVLNVPWAVLGLILLVPMTIFWASMGIGTGTMKEEAIVPACLFWIIMAVGFLYNLYLNYSAVRTVHSKLDKWRAIGALLAYSIIISIAGMIIYATLMLIGI